MRHILVFEYLHAQPALYRDASASMRAEGRAMLLAVVADLAAIDNVQVHVAVCAAAANGLPLPADVVLLPCDEITETAFVAAVLENGDFDDVLPIAPETGGVLYRLVEEFRRHGRNVMAPSLPTLAWSSSKWRTFCRLRQHGLPTIPTERIDDIQRLGLIDNATCVVKPVDGAGCEGVFSCPVGDIGTAVPISERGIDAIVQPLVVGDSYSVGMIGSTLLPVAAQHITWTNGRPQYLGGTISPPLPADSRRELEQLLQQLLVVIPAERGYLGVDLLRTSGTDSPAWLITEINPRLCTSYLGYRHATDFNLAGLLLDDRSADSLRWGSEPTPFDYDR